MRSRRIRAELGTGGSGDMLIRRGVLKLGACDKLDVRWREANVELCMELEDEANGPEVDRMDALLAGLDK